SPRTRRGERATRLHTGEEQRRHSERVSHGFRFRHWGWTGSRVCLRVPVASPFSFRASVLPCLGSEAPRPLLFTPTEERTPTDDHTHTTQTNRTPNTTNQGEPLRPHPHVAVILPTPRE